MNEEAVKYAFDLFVRDGYKGDISKFQKLLATNQEALDYSFTLFERDGYKGGKNKYKVLMGLGETAAPVATTEPTTTAPATTEPAKTEVIATTAPAKTEPAKTEPAKTEPAKTEPAKTEPAKELSNKQSETIKVRSIPQREVEMPVADETKMPPMVVKEAEPEVKEEPKKELPVSTGLIPVTEKTEVKAVEIPSDKMVIKSEKKEEEPKLKIKLKEVNTVPADVIEGKGLFVSEDLKGIKLPKYTPEEIIDKKLLTENKEVLGLKQFEDDELIFKKWLESKGMPLDTKEENLNRIDRPEYDKYRYNQQNNRIRAIVDSYLPYLIENKDKLSSEYQEKLREELTSPTFKSFVQGFRGDFYNYDKNNPNFKLIEKVNEEYWRDPTIYSHVKSQYGIQDGEKQELDANEFLQSPILNNSEKVITKFGPMFYDKENDTYYKYEYGILNAEPYIKYNLRKYPDYKVPLEVIKPGTEQHKLIKEGNKETWDGVDRTMYRGTSVKKDGNMQVKEVTEQPKMEVKEVTKEEPKMVIKSEKKAEEEPMKVMTEKEKKEWQCPPAEGGCPKNKKVVQDYIYEKYEKDGDKSVMSIIDREGNLARFIDGSEGGGTPGILKEYKHRNYNRNDRIFTYSAEEPPKSERFSVYNVPVDGVETSVIYDNKTGVILKDTKDVITSEDGKPIKTWMDVPIMYDEYQTLKAEIDKAKGGTTAPKVSAVPTLEPWQQPQGNMQVKEVTEQPKMEVKSEPTIEAKEVTKEEPKMVIKSEKKKEEVNQQTPTFSKPIIINGAKFDDDMNLMRTFRPSGFEEYKELSKLAKPVDKSLDEIAQSFSKHFESIQLDRNISLSFPDPPNAKKKSVVTQNTENIFEDKIDNKNVYSYYDEKNKKWYIYNKEKDENNWNEVTSPQIKTVLNTKYKNNSGEIDKSKIFKTEEAESDKIIKIKEYYYYNKYLPTLIENWDNLKENQKESIKKDLNVLLMKRLSRDMYHKEKYKEEINDIKERIKRNETVDEIDMNILKFGNPDERYDKFWEYVVEKTGAGDEELKALIKKYKK